MRLFLRLLGIAGIVICVVLFVGILIHATTYAPQAETAIVAPSVPTEDAPSRLVIPSLSIDAPVEEVGVLVNGRMAAPKKYSEVAWYKYGPTPGSSGSAVIAGHLDNGLGMPGVFKNLADLSPGAEIDVITTTGKTMRFKTLSKQTYAYDAVPSSIFTATDAARLNLITCEGDPLYTKETGLTYNKRMVVYAVRENS